MPVLAGRLASVSDSHGPVHPSRRQTRQHGGVRTGYERSPWHKRIVSRSGPAPGRPTEPSKERTRPSRLRSLMARPHPITLSRSPGMERPAAKSATCDLWDATGGEPTRLIVRAGHPGSVPETGLWPAGAAGVVRQGARAVNDIASVAHQMKERGCAGGAVMERQHTIWARIGLALGPVLTPRWLWMIAAPRISVTSIAARHPTLRATLTT